jgi:uncharacterized BrkB/YihY/UPF0761 family membrane protein
MRTKIALIVIFLFTYLIYYLLNIIGVNEHHDNLIWAFATSIVFLLTLLIDVYLFFAIAKEDAYKWDID